MAVVLWAILGTCLELEHPPPLSKSCRSKASNKGVVLAKGGRTQVKERPHRHVLVPPPPVSIEQ